MTNGLRALLDRWAVKRVEARRLPTALPTALPVTPLPVTHSPDMLGDSIDRLHQATALLTETVTARVAALPAPAPAKTGPVYRVVHDGKNVYRGTDSDAAVACWHWMERGDPESFPGAKEFWEGETQRV